MGQRDGFSPGDVEKVLRRYCSGSNGQAGKTSNPSSNPYYPDYGIDGPLGLGGSPQYPNYGPPEYPNYGPQGGFGLGPQGFGPGPQGFGPGPQGFRLGPIPSYYDEE